MKMIRKILNIIIVLLIMICTFQFSCASTETLERPDDTLGITKKIDITSSNKYLIEKTPYVDADEKIYDFADLFTSSEEEKLYENIQNFIKKHNMDLVIVTIDYNDKSSAQAYADDFYDYNDFGIGNKYDGILFLIDMDNRRMEISTTGNAIEPLQSEIDTILDNCYSYISNEDYFDCANTFITSTENALSTNTVKIHLISVGVVIILSLIIPTIFCLIVKSRHKNVKLARYATAYLVNNSFKVTHSNDTFIRTHTSKTPKASSSSSGGSRSGSSGISHGGGGRSF